MKPVILDSSVVLAVLFKEPGHEAAAAAIGGATMSAVNVSEVLARCIDSGVAPGIALDFIEVEGIEIVPFDLEHSQSAAALRAIPKAWALSFGDRACLALAIQRQGRAVTGDRIWSTFDLPCDVAFFR
jgi:PIN domain nuclease of toxin-antitoxin system